MQLIVGDKFSTFAKAVGALTCSQAVEAMASRRLTGEVVIGQGLSDEDVERVRILCKDPGTPFVPPAQGRRRAGRDVTHKHVPANSLISVPRRTSDHVLQSDVLIDDENEIMSDHMTGCHVQGMLLIEAVRQIFLAAVEDWKDSTSIMHKPYVIIHSIDISFENFTFPVDAIIRHTTVSIDMEARGRVAFKAILEVEQNDIRCAVAKVDYSAVEGSIIGPKEAAKAKRCVDTFMARIPGRVDDAPSIHGPIGSSVAIETEAVP